MYTPAPFVSRIAFASVLTLSCSLLTAATISVDGQNVKKLSEAIASAIAADDGPHVINITADKLPLSDTSFVITEPVTINGDADGNGKKCDILVDIAAIQKSPARPNRPQKCYMEITSPGRVEINDLQIHPDKDASGPRDVDLVDAIRMYCPSQKSDVAEYVLNRVWISGSDGNNADAFIPLNTFDDLYKRPGVKMWGRQVPMINRGIIHTANRKNPKFGEQRGSYNLTMNDCQVGLGRAVALNLTATDGNHVINGGLYGHTGTEGIRIAGKTATLTGSAAKPLVIVRAANASEGMHRNLTVFKNGDVAKMENVAIIPNPGEDSGALNIMTGGSVGSRNKVDILTKPAEIATAMGIKPPEIEMFNGWLEPQSAWAQAQQKKQQMLLFFYSPDVAMAEKLNKLMESDSTALSFLAKAAAARVNIKDSAGEAVAKSYGVYKVPTLLLISPDAKSYKKITPDVIDTWPALENQLKLD
jgi:hypothetical protein